MNNPWDTTSVASLLSLRLVGKYSIVEWRWVTSWICCKSNIGKRVLLSVTLSYLQGIPLVWFRCLHSLASLPLFLRTVVILRVEKHLLPQIGGFFTPPLALWISLDVSSW